MSPKGTGAVSLGLPCSSLGAGPVSRCHQCLTSYMFPRRTGYPHAGSPVPICYVSPAEDEQLFRSVEGQAASEEEEEERWQEKPGRPQAHGEVSLVQPSGCVSR